MRYQFLCLSPFLPINVLLVCYYIRVSFNIMISDFISLSFSSSFSLSDGEGGEVSPPVGAGINSNSWHFRYGSGPGYIPPQALKPGELPPEAFIIPGSPAIISIRQDSGTGDDKGDFITFGKKEESKKKKKKKKEKKRGRRAY